ncbi:enoyl-CoA hydratase/isomerase family protein [Halobacillus salinus]|uniref:enoyl-CoA hydratase/isomerase family protein n=1 Tax=Halobacillus salinus TaxID=192814 RepID=UPI0009A5BD4D|nr:enoyl-CoA hydratase/isomerase family protein [Halobacillus salinus]
MSLVLLDWMEDGYAVITLNRPEKLNAINHQMVQELDEALDLVRKEDHVKFLTVTGKGDKAFCAGGDLNEFHGNLEEDEAYDLLAPMKNVLYKLATLPIPTIALLNGQARGGGCEIATACDFRYALKGTSFGFIQGKLGIAPGWGGGTLLYEKVDKQAAAHWLMTATMYSTDQALRIGWLHKVYSDKEWAMETLLQPFLHNSQEQMTWFKKQYLNSLKLDELSVRMEEETISCSKLWESEAHKEAVQKFMLSRKN